MAYAKAVPNSVFNLTERNSLANTVISDYAVGHAVLDVVIGAAGLLVPGGGLVAMIASIAAQAPLVYQPMVKKLARIYSASPDKVTTRIVTENAIIGAFGDVGSELVVESLSSEFGQEFLLEILNELVPELGIGGIASWIPFVGGFIAAGLDATLAATLTWRVGTMTTMYFLHGEQWIQSRKETHSRAKAIVGSPSPKAKHRVDLNIIPQRVPEIRNKTVQALLQQIRMVRKGNPSISQDQLRAFFREEGIPDYFIEEALREDKKGPIAA